MPYLNPLFSSAKLTNWLQLVLYRHAVLCRNNCFRPQNDNGVVHCRSNIAVDAVCLNTAFLIYETEQPVLFSAVSRCRISRPKHKIGTGIIFCCRNLQEMPNFNSLLSSVEAKQLALSVAVSIWYQYAVL